MVKKLSALLMGYPIYKMAQVILSFLVLAVIIPWPSHAGLPDPTQPSYPLATLPQTTVADMEAEPKLSAIWISKKSRWITINGIQAKQGQSISGNIRIIKIRRNTVTINQNGTVKTLQLIKRPYHTR